MSDEIHEEIRSLRKALAGISIRLDTLERAAAGTPRPTVAPPPAPRAPAPPVAAVPLATVAAAPPDSTSPALPRENLELKIGRYWLNRLGILSLVLGTAFFLVYSFQYLGPAAKIAMGYAVGATLLILGLRLERRPGLAWYALGLMGGGWAVLYFTTYAMYHVPETRILSSALVDLVLLLLVAGGAVRHALTKRSQTITVLAFLLGFLTTGISEVTYFTFASSVILVGALVWLAARMRWHWLLLYGLIGSYVTHLVAVQPHIARAGGTEPSVFWLSAAFLALYAIGYSIGVLAMDEKEESRRGALLAATLINGWLVPLLLLPLLHSAYPGNGWIALLILGAVSLALSAIAGGRGLGAVSTTHLFLGLMFATVAIPLKLTHRSTEFFWMAEVALLSTIGVRFARWPYRLFALLLGVTALFWILPFEAWNTSRYEAFGWSVSWRWTIGAVAILCYAIAAAASRRLTPDRFREPAERHSFHVYAAAACIVLWVLTWTTASVATKPLYWALEGVLVTLLGWGIRDRGIRLIGALWMVWPALHLVGLLCGIGLWNPASGLTVVASLYALGLLYRRDAPAPAFGFERYLAGVYAITASLLLAGVIWHEVARPWLSLAWALESLALVAIGWVLRDKHYRLSSLLVLMVLVPKILYLDLPGLGPWNKTGALLVIAILYAISLLYRRPVPEPSFGLERHLTSIYAVTASLVLAGVLWHDMQRRWLSLGWAVEGLALVVIGFRLPDKYYRVSGLVMFALLLLKILFVDLAAAETIWRILSFVGAGAILLLASYGYAKFNAREKGQR